MDATIIRKLLDKDDNKMVKEIKGFCKFEKEEERRKCIRVKVFLFCALRHFDGGPRRGRLPLNRQKRGRREKEKEWAREIREK